MKNYFFISCWLLLYGCKQPANFNKSEDIRDAFFNGSVTVEKIDKLNKYCVSIKDTANKTIDKIYTPYTIFDLQTGDINYDGKTDFCVGIIKPTPFDSVLKKRLFIFQIDRNYIRPLWLGSRLSHPYEKFIILKDPENKNCIRAIEKENKNLYCITEYKWGSFGMVFRKQCAHGLPFSKAEALLTKIY